MKKGLFKRKPKRTTFGKMFAKAMIIPVLLSVIFGFLLHYYIEYKICDYAWGQQSSLQNELNLSIHTSEDINDKFGGTLKVTDFKMGLGTYYDTNYTQNLPYSRFLSYFAGYASSYYDRNGVAVAALIDEDGRILASNMAKMWFVVRYSEDPDDNKWFSCDPVEVDIPDFTALINEELEAHYTEHDSYIYNVTSAYLNNSEHKMIPHTIKKTKYYSENRYDEDDNKVVSEEEVVINTGDFDLTGYEFMDFSDNSSKYPIASFEMISGTDNKEVGKVIFEKYNSTGYEWREDPGLFEVRKENPMYLSVTYNDKKCRLFTYYKVNVWTRSVKRMYCILLGLFLLFVTLIAFVRCLIKNAKNKAQYAFEDYQRALTNNLAHDLKTPLAVIGGYAENLMEMRKESGDEKELQYLGSIMKNVAYTDDIIAKTLKLSETEQTKKLNKKKVDIKALAEKYAEKYKDALEERGIELSVEGNGEVNADGDSLSLAVDNLISNAVKYTRNDGSVKITVSKKEFVIENDTVENIDTKELKMPFVKGDKARSDKSSSGLGLSIAEAAAVQNGFALKLSCKDQKFKAMIEM